MSNEPGQRADLGPRLDKVSVNCLCGCHRKINIEVWPGTKRLPPMKSHYCKRLEKERFGEYWV